MKQSYIFFIKLFSVVDSLTIENSKTTLEIELEENYRVRVGRLQFRWDLILVYVFLRFLQGGGFGKKS